jgi:deoxyribodipyrimidine photo-lyase
MRLEGPVPGREVDWVAEHLGHLCADEPVASPRFTGTQAAADAALAAFDVRGYAARRSVVSPVGRRGASRLSPWIRHGLLTLPEVWAHVAGGPSADVAKYRDELLWQEYARHLYARLGSQMGEPLRHRVGTDRRTGGGWDRSMRCIDTTLTELERDGWIVNQTRMWLASDWTVRHGEQWRHGEDHFFRHLLDGSRAANRAGWQWTVGTATGRPYGFSRHQVVQRAPDLCGSCLHASACPVEAWPDATPGPPVGSGPDRLRRDPDPAATAGPSAPRHHGEPELVWLTAESLGDADPALAAHPDLPVVFVFDEPLLARLRLSGKRLVFLAQRLAELGSGRDLEVRLGRPGDELAGRALAATFTPVPGWRALAARLDPAVVHPWPWLRPPAAGSLASFSAWNDRRPAGRPATRARR